MGLEADLHPHSNQPVVASSRRPLPGTADHTVGTHEDAALFSRGPNLRVDAMLNYSIVKRNEVAILRAAAGAIDCDLNILLNTAESMHDGPTARFAIASTITLLQLQNRSGVPLLEDHHLEQLSRSDNLTAFDHETWDPFRKLTGFSESKVTADIAAALHDRFGLQRRGLTIDLEAFRALCCDVVNSHWDHLTRDVQPDMHLLATLDRMSRHHGIPLHVCSASSTDVVTRALKEKDAIHPFSAIQGGATKKNDHGFVGDSFARCFEDMGVPAHQGFVSGDGLPDFGGGFMSGAGVAVIRLPEAHGDDDSLALAANQLIRKASNILLKQARIGDSHALLERFAAYKVIFVHSYNQLFPGGKPNGNDSAHASIVPCNDAA